jgi:hypothetical protein
LWRAFPAELFLFMATRRREQRYIEFRELRWLVPNAEWGAYLRQKLTVRVSKRVAQPRCGVDVVWEAGKHLLRDRERGIEVSIPSTWPKESDAIKDPRYLADPVRRQREILETYGVDRGGWKAASGGR